MFNKALSASLWLHDKGMLPDVITRLGSRQLIGIREKEIHSRSASERQQYIQAFVDELKAMPIAINTSDANEQHYEIPPEFYDYCLGKYQKYSCCFWNENTPTLDDAELHSLELTVERAKIQDGESVLELGCGWGSLTMFMAKRFPKSKIVGVSNSNSQREWITKRCEERGLSNVTIITCDINDFHPPKEVGLFDRVVSVEMFEHMKNYEKLLQRISTWMKPEATLFVHIFTHSTTPYHFEDENEDDWITRYFFLGGTMPSDDLLLYFQKDLTIKCHWQESGIHYAKTARAWLEKMDANIGKVKKLFAQVYGEENATTWTARWRTFYIAVEELWKYNNGNEWTVSHYLFEKPKIEGQAPSRSVSTADMVKVEKTYTVFSY